MYKLITGKGKTIFQRSVGTASRLQLNSQPVGLPVVSGLVEVGETITIDISGVSDADGIYTPTYQWYRDGVAIPGETNATYTIVAADEETDLTAVVTWVGSNDIVETLATGTASVPLYNIVSYVRTLYNLNVYPSTTETFGGDWAVDIEGDYVVVGSPHEDTATAPNSGKMFIHRISTNTTQTISSPDPTAVPALFGHAVCIKNGLIAVTSPYAGSSETTKYGRLHIYNTNGSKLRTITGPNIYYHPDFTTVNDSFGEYHVSLNNSGYVGIGSPRERHDIPFSSQTWWEPGTAHIYNANTGSKQITLYNPYGEENSYNFGWNVEIGDNYAAIMSLGNSSIGSRNELDGEVHVYYSASGNWTDAVRTGSIVPTPGSQGFFGEGMHIDGTTLYVGYRHSDFGTYDNLFSVRKYNLTNRGYLGKIVCPSGQTYSGFGQLRVDTTATKLVIGERLYDGPGDTGQGIVYIYDKATETLLQTITNPSLNTTTGDRFGQAVRTTDTHVAVYAQRETPPDEDATKPGAIHIYEYK